MKQTLRLLGAVTLLGITGCQFNQPPVSSIGAWEKPGADFTEIGKALLECGMPTPYDRDPENDNRSFNQMATIDACMLQAGFRYKYDVGGGWCGNHKAENLPICRPGAVIPQRSVKKRLNSPFCKKHPEQYECQP
ncbi:hypothetical protein [Bartonella henselae]|uniref:Hypothetical genomic island protein n=1 Tax=Bartonella henselae (strain ATCC 49882 / DSM 28221 / CCUG 30454 / Houston 1) TaxID=283166 RepID=A0A0H3LYC0_BARHE|nr:hypothetical protein [Bartonella henselae]ATP12310.1 hypothetical protein BhenCHDE101_03840 [Bartonella henselae]ETS08478.1 hypothetical protein Q655_00743 [Bartonella henselae JK 51]ETS09025.1 hypothetical protein Q654_00790 [Bartonella henselae JK 50]PNM38431.1 hypothetical protein AL470_003110 [Bartonella henselae str. Houston-1]UAK84834.1 hypothetical protein K8O99_03665 [Bartonella henselae]